MSTVIVMVIAQLPPAINDRLHDGPYMHMYSALAVMYFN